MSLSGCRSKSVMMPGMVIDMEEARLHTSEKISEASLLLVIRQLLEGFPFIIAGFHAENGSAYSNEQVATLLEKLRIEVTKFRPRQSNDHALAESKNGVVVRKH